MKEDTLLQLESEVNELKAWKRARESERLVYPVDQISLKTLNYWRTPTFNGLLLATGRTSAGVTSFITDLNAIGLEIELNGQKRILLIQLTLHRFTADHLTDYITDVNGPHHLNNGDRVSFTTDVTLPGGLSPIVLYYVVNKTSNTFQVSTTLGGSPVNITDDGTGTFYYSLA